MSKMSENFIMLFNRSFSKGDDRLFPLELFLYSFLYRSRLEYESGWISSTNISLIASKIKCKVDGKGNEKLDTIKSALLNLAKNKYIFTPITENTKKDDLLDITFPIIVPNQEGFQGFLQIPYRLFDTFDNRESYYIYTFLESNYNTEHKRHYRNKLSYTDWADLLKVSKGTAQNRLEAMNTSESNPRIYKFSGNYSGTEKQDENTYFTRPDEKTLLKWNNFYDGNGKAKYVHKNKYSREDIIYSPFEGEITIADFEDVMELSAWGKLNDYLSDNYNPEGNYLKIEIEDYYIYKTCKDFSIDPKFIQKCEHIIKAKKNSFNYDYCFEDWDEKYADEDQDKVVSEIYDIRRKQREAYDERMKDYDYENDNPF